MSEERKPAFWVVKRPRPLHDGAGEYWGPIESDTAAHAWVMAGTRRSYATRAAASDACVNLQKHGQAGHGCWPVPVYVTVRKMKRAHSWTWACKRLLEGEKVRRVGWPSAWLIGYEDFVSVCNGPLSQSYIMSKRDMRATDWELMP